MSDQLLQLVRPFPPHLVHGNPSGRGQYVAHDVIVQRLLQVLGPFTYEIREVIRGDVDAIYPDPQGASARAKEGRAALAGAVVGVIARLTVEVDGRTVSVEDVGDCEDPHNWPHDGARLKDACSDAIKRCAMRLGCGLHLWAQQDFYLYERLKEDAKPARDRPGVGLPFDPPDAVGPDPELAPGPGQQTIDGGET